MGVAAGVNALGWAFIHKTGFSLSASVTVAGPGLILRADTLPSQVLFGKNLVVPVTVNANTGPINPNNLRVDIVYQLLDPNGNAVNAPRIVPISFITGPTSAPTLRGSAIVPRADLAPIQQGGSVTYVFQARQGGSGAGTMLRNSGPAPLRLPSKSKKE